MTSPEPRTEPPTVNTPSPKPAPKEERFVGFADRECGEHRTVGPHRAWCHTCTEWCYPTAACKGCELPSLRVRVESLAVENAELRAQLEEMTESRDHFMAEADAFHKRLIEADGGVL